MKKKKNEEEIEESWNKKRIGIALFILVILLAGAVLFTREQLYLNTSSEKSSSNVFSSNEEKLEEVIAEQIESIKEQAINIDASEVASSSPEIQTFINSLKSLKDYPKSQIKKTCEQICRDL